MSDIKIKLCGLSRPEDIAVANELAVDYIGFVFVKKSKRYISIETACMLSEQLSKDIKVVGVFQNQTKEEIISICQAKNKRGNAVISAVQLHGDETNEQIHALKEMTNLPIIKAVGIKDQADIETANHSVADLVLLDSPGGGTGELFDSRLLCEMRRPYILAGGLTPQNVYDKLRQIQPYGVDVSSGIETDGHKDADKMQLFVHEVRRF